MINIANLSEEFPIWVSPDEYEDLKKRKTGGWSNCETQKEWMIKLHYLRSGFKEGKNSRDDFFKREGDLVVNWWRKWC